MSHRGKISLMLLFFSVCCSAALLTYQMRMRQSAVPHTDLYRVVVRQLSAFQDADFHRAYDEASSGVQQKFSLQDFTQMIRTNYSGIVRPGRVELGAVRVEGDRAYVEVFFIDRRGTVRPCVYILLNEGESWKIDGARMLPPWPRGRTLSGAQV